MEASVEKTSESEQRAQKKAARRAAFIQEVAEAVYTLGVQRQNEIEAKRRAQADAVSEQARLRAKLADAELAAASPIEALYCLNNNVERGYRWVGTKMSLEEYRSKEALAWAIKAGILPEGTPGMPTTEAQFQAYATWRVATGKV